MLKYLMILSAVAALVTSLPARADTTGKTVEVMLSAKLDEARGYCLDIAGGQGTSAPLDKGLQAHTCYHYKGSILEDQGFDAGLISKGQFKINYFDVCMAASAHKTGATLGLEKCTNSDLQKFTLQAGGQLSPAANPSLCVTVSSTEKREGRGSTPIHVMRPLSLQACDAAQKDYQTWLINAL